MFILKFLVGSTLVDIIKYLHDDDGPDQNIKEKTTQDLSMTYYVQFTMVLYYLLQLIQ